MSRMNAARVERNPIRVNVNNALYILHTIIPISSVQCSTSHALARVGLMNHVNRLQLSVHRMRRKPLSARLRRGFRPMQQCSTMVKIKARIEKNEADVSQMNVHGTA